MSKFSIYKTNSSAFKEKNSVCMTKHIHSKYMCKMNCLAKQTQCVKTEFETFFYGFETDSNSVGKFILRMCMVVTLDTVY